MTLAGWSGSRSVRALFWASAIFSFVMAVLPHPPMIPGNPSDKLQHIAAFVTMSALGAWAYPRFKLLRLLALLSAFGAAIEVFQAIPALHRDSDVWDWVGDTAAVSVVLLAVWLRRRRASA